MVTFLFDVTCPSCVQNDTSVLDLTRLVDDIELFGGTDGTFTYICPTATPTNTPPPVPTDTPEPAPTDTPTGPTPTPLPIPVTGPFGFGILIAILSGLLLIPRIRRKS